jgi:ketol-acid reductoisomerase
MRYSISDTAEYGDYSRGAVVIDEHVRDQMRKVLATIQSGQFAKEWIAEMDEGEANLKRVREEQRNLQIEQVGLELRALMAKTP